jgi:hypothetical protein
VPVPRVDLEAVEVTLENYRQLSELLRKSMRRGHHYGRFEGWSGDSLFEPGASLILNVFRLWSDPVRVDRTEDDEEIRYNTIVYLRPIGSRDVVVSAGIGVASTLELKYHRWVLEAEIPSDSVKADLKTKESGGRTLYRIPNPDPSDIENTVAKVALKRAEVDAVHHLPGVSELFPRAQAQEAR